MQCLYCGKELAFLKRLTGGVEFCSDAHRKKYQEEFNDLALNRLLQSHPKGPFQQAGVELAAPPPPVAPPPPPREDAPEMAAFLVETLSARNPEPAAILHGDAAILLSSPPALPQLDLRLGKAIRDNNRALAEFVAWEPFEAKQATIPGAKFSIDPLEFSQRPTEPLLPCPQWERDRFEWLPEPSRDPLDPVMDQPCHPAGEPAIWLASPLPFAPVPLRLDFDVIRSGEAVPEPLPPPPPMDVQPLPVTLQAVGPGFAKAVAVIGDALPPRPELLAPQGLPLRPTIILRSKPAELSSAAAVTESVAPHRAEGRAVPPSPPLPKLAEPAPREEPKAASRSAVADIGLPELRPVEDKGIWARMSAVVKIGLAAAIVLGIGGLAYLTLNSGSATAKSIPARPVWNTGRQINMNGWIEDWAPGDPLRRVTLLRGTESLSNYRLEFTAQIQNKAVGWMFRGLNPKNYYVAKVEKIKPGLEPVVAFVRYAVIDGKNEGRVEKALSMKVRADTSYKVRFEATGARFSAWILGEKVDEWEDARLGSGGLGLYSEGDEAPALHGGVNAWELVSNSVGQ